MQGFIRLDGTYRKQGNVSGVEDYVPGLRAIIRFQAEAAG